MQPNYASNPTQIGFFLIAQFSMLSMSAAVEPRRLANRLSKCNLYEWSFYSKDYLPVRASNGIDVAATREMADTEDLDALIVVAGIDVENHDDPVLSLHHLRLYVNWQFVAGSSQITKPKPLHHPLGKH
jgi:transcriptional regulator GlxA family with amidase domain